MSHRTLHQTKPDNALRPINIPQPLRHWASALATRLLILSFAAPAGAASISTYEFLLDGPDSLAFISDSIAGSTFSNRIQRYRISDGTMSKMASDVASNTNLVTMGTSIVWFTTRDAPYRIGRADLSTVTGSPTYYTPAEITAPFDDMAVGPGNSLWATSAKDGRVVRVTQTGTITLFSGDGAIHPVGITQGKDGNMWFADGVGRRIVRIDPQTGAFTYYPVPQLSAATVPERIAAAETGVIWFATDDGFGSVDPTTGEVHVVATEVQQPRRLAVAPDGSLWMTNGTPSVTQFTPPANHAKLRLFEDPAAESAGLYIDAAGGTLYVSDRRTAQLARIAVARDTPADATVTEFYNERLNHYFVTANPAEAAAIDSGSAGAGWARTGESWSAWTGGPIPNAAEVCRFYGASDIDPQTGLRRGPNSHFYTVLPGECAAVKLDTGWTYEAAGAFWAIKPEGAGPSSCPSWTQPVFRAFNNRAAFNDSNHRYTVSQAVFDQMVAAGWSAEGVVMCAPR